MRCGWVIVVVVLLGQACAAPRSATADADAVKQVIADYYDTFYRSVDEKKYRALLTDDYRLLENGEIFDANADVALLPKPADEYQRTDAFDFHSVHVDHDTAYATYVLRSRISDKKDGARNREWLESAILRRGGASWQVAVLHSTRITKPASTAVSPAAGQTLQTPGGNP